MVREIVFDTETTGFDPKSGDRLVEIGAIELFNHVPTGRVYHQYINPERDMPESAFKVHGLSEEFLRKYPKFYEIAEEFLDFVGEDVALVGHNALGFDINFLNFELEKAGKPTLERSRIVDTLDLAKKLFPGAKNNLDALCKRFGIDNAERVSNGHGALLDSQLLARVYLELLGGIEPSMDLGGSKETVKENIAANEVASSARKARVFDIPQEELAAHNEFLEKTLKNAFWLS